MSSTTFARRILHHGSDPNATPVLLSSQAVSNCWFELHRQGGCGRASVTLDNAFIHREHIEIGDWISFELTPGTPVYLGRVEERVTESPAQLSLRLAGMAIELNEIFPGGFGTKADGIKPHRYAATDIFSYDPDRSDETLDVIQTVEQFVELLLHQHVVGKTHIQFVPDLVEQSLVPTDLTSFKFHGEESLRAILKELALRAQSASWGVNAAGEFFFLRPATNTQTTFREGYDLTALREVRDYELLFNRLLVTGDYIYDRRDASDGLARRSYRWRANFVEPVSRATFGDRRLKIWLPWVRTQSDALGFAREFFRVYAQPSTRYLIETAGQHELPLPWQGKIALQNIAGDELIVAHIETLRVHFDHVLRFRMELGPEDPRELWPEPPQDDRWELPDQQNSAGGDVSVPDPPPPPPPPPPPSSESSQGTSSVGSSGSSGSWGSSGSEESSESSHGSSNSDSLSDGSSSANSTGETGSESGGTSSPATSSQMHSSSANSSGSSASESQGSTASESSLSSADESSGNSSDAESSSDDNQESSESGDSNSSGHSFSESASDSHNSSAQSDGSSADSSVIDSGGSSEPDSSDPSSAGTDPPSSVDSNGGTSSGLPPSSDGTNESTITGSSDISDFPSSATDSFFESWGSDGETFTESEPNVT